MKRRRSLPSPIAKRSVHIGGRKTSIALEDGFWNALKEIAAIQGISIHEIVLKVDGMRESHNLSSAIRLFILDYYRQKASDKARS